MTFAKLTDHDAREVAAFREFLRERAHLRNLTKGLNEAAPGTDQHKWAAEAIEKSKARMRSYLDRALLEDQ